jgi:hypothetical protein
MTNVVEIMAIHLNRFLKIAYYAYSRNYKQKHVNTLSLPQHITTLDEIVLKIRFQPNTNNVVLSNKAH